MNVFRMLYCRTFQTVFRMALPLLPYRTPEILTGTDRLPELFRELAERMGCAFFDASGLVSYGGGDHMHLSAEEHARLAAAMAAEVKKLI